MRKRHNLAPRMEACAEYLIEDPASLRGQWRESFPGYNKLYVELGCGKGRFTVETARQNPDALMIAIEKVPDAMVLAMERARDEGLPNVRFMDFDAAELAAVFAPGEIDRIYLNFSDPWPKSRDAKFRLTAPGFLRLYADALPLGGEIHFKTDNTPLFDWSVEQFKAEGWALSELTHDLHAAGPVGVMTDYEAKFVAEGLKINRLAAARTADTRTTAAGPVPRLRNAALGDARGKKRQPPEEPIRLAPATRPFCHAYFRRFRQSPELFEDRSKCKPYVYDSEKVDAWFDERAARPDERRFFVLTGEDKPIGELVLKRIDPEQKRCAMGICLVNEHWKNHGYGTAAERLGLRQAFDELGMETVLADSLLQNTRSQHVLQKVGFRFMSEDEHFKYYQITKEQFLAKVGEE
jgi:tRNA (guanine-N7-)-methyltransferase